MADLDVSGLSQDQLQKLNQALVTGWKKDEVSELVNYFNDGNKIKDPANAPAPPKAPIPATLDPAAGNLHRLVNEPLSALNQRNEKVNDLAEKFYASGRGVSGYLQNPTAHTAQDSPGPSGGFNIPDLASLVPGISTSGKILPATLSSLASLTTKTPGDLATLVATTGAGNLLQGLKAVSQPANSLLRAAQGASLYTGGKVMSDVTNGRDVKFSLWDLAFGGLSAGLGSVQGASEVPSAKTKQLMKLQTAFQAYKEHQEQVASLQTAEKKAAEEALAATNSHADAEKALKSFEEQTGISKKLKDKNFLSYLRAQQMFGKPTPEVEQIEQQGKLKAAAEAALEAKRKAEAVRPQIRTQIAELMEKAPPKPEAPKDSDITSILKAAAKKTIPGAAGAEFGSLLHASPLLGMIGGVMIDQITHSDAGQKLLDFVGRTMGPNATRLVPSLVNQRGQEK